MTLLNQSAIAARAAQLHEIQLRPFLHTHMCGEHPFAVCLALLYELTSAIAAMSDTEEQARALLATGLKLAEHQIKEFGVGKPHP